MKRTFIGIGTNLGNREDNLKNALLMIEEFIGPVRGTSSVYETEPWGFSSENNFLNMVAEVETRLNPSGLLGRILMIESLLGRTRTGRQYASRIIDLDILFFNKRIINKAELKIPHPLLHERKFVLVPLCEIAPDFEHPILKKTVQTLLEKCKDKGKVKKYKKN